MKTWLPLLVLVCSLPPSLALADDPPPALAALEANLTAVLVTPLEARDAERARFSRAKVPPTARRLRTETTLLTDARGRPFVRFAIDAKRGGGWRSDDVTGCVYVSGEVFVKTGAVHRPAAFLLGKKVSAAEDRVCEATTEGLALKDPRRR